MLFPLVMIVKTPQIQHIIQLFRN